VDCYRDFIVEEVLPHSHAKFAHVLGEAATVGALSRLNLAAPVTPVARQLFQAVQDQIVDGDIRANALAQAVELYQAAERALELVDQLLASAGEAVANVKVEPAGGRGSAACEAPRGLLIHSYLFDQAGICRAADVITPTSLNQGALARDLNSLAGSLEGADATELSRVLQRLVRCYDPCISCAVHLVRR